MLHHPLKRNTHGPSGPPSITKLTDEKPPYHSPDIWIMSGITFTTQSVWELRYVFVYLTLSLSLTVILYIVILLLYYYFVKV